MNCCQERSAQLMEYAEGSLPSAQAAELESHLSSCSCCRKELESWRRLEARLRAFPLVSEPAGLKSAVMNRIAETRTAAVPMASMPVDPMLAGALGALLLGMAALLAGVGAGAWELSFDTGYWMDLASQVATSVWALAVNAGGLVLSGLTQTIYSDLMGAAPALAAALLLALFAIGPSELMSAVNLQSRES